MNSIPVGKKNSTSIKLYDKDRGSGQPVIFSHGWPLSADVWKDQMVFLGDRGYRCITHDRSSQPWNGNDMDIFADDLATFVDALSLKNAIYIGRLPPTLVQDRQRHHTVCVRPSKIKLTRICSLSSRHRGPSNAPAKKENIHEDQI